jgi:hypothetical protein
MPSLTRERVCNLLLLLGLTNAVPLGPESLGTQYHILLSQFFRFPQPGGRGSRIYIPRGHGGSVIPPGTGFPFRRLLRLAGLRILTRLHTGWEVEVTLRLTDSQSVSQSVCLGIEYPCGTCDQILLPVGMLLSEICGPVSRGRPL